jgi:hypothetical protein
MGAKLGPLSGFLTLDSSAAQGVVEKEAEPNCDAGGSGKARKGNLNTKRTKRTKRKEISA